MSRVSRIRIQNSFVPKRRPERSKSSHYSANQSAAELAVAPEPAQQRISIRQAGSRQPAELSRSALVRLECHRLICHLSQRAQKDRASLRAIRQATYSVKQEDCAVMDIHTEVVNYLFQNYAIAPIDRITPVTAGFLSENYVLHANGEKYFLKQYRYTQWQAVAAAHEAKFFFAQANVPVILPLTNRSGETFFAVADQYYSLFPFVQGRHLPRGGFSLRALDSCAKLLADIHRAGRQAQPIHVRKTKITRSYTAFMEEAQAILQKIPQVGRTAFDDLAETCLQLKLRLAQQHKADFAAINLASDHLIHGDYQDANLFFDAHEQVSHVFDWEKTEVAPRALELVRALEFICLSNPDDYKAVFSEENYAKARHFLQSYQQHYPIAQSEFFAAAQTRYLHKIVSLWVEADHYLADNQRVDVFLEAEYHAVNYYAQHLNEHVEHISGGLMS